LIPTLLVVAAATCGSVAQNTPTPEEDRRLKAATGGEDVGISGRDGITVSGADVFVTRNGRSEKLEKPLTLDGGTKINPDGTVRLADGREITLRAEQRLTFDGRLLASPIPPNTPVVPAPVGGGGGSAGNAAVNRGVPGQPGVNATTNNNVDRNNDDRNNRNNNNGVVPFIDPGAVVNPGVTTGTGTGTGVNPTTGPSAAPLGQPATAGTPAGGSNPNATGTTTSGNGTSGTTSGTGVTSGGTGTTGGGTGATSGSTGGSRSTAPVRSGGATGGSTGGATGTGTSGGATGGAGTSGGTAR